MSWPPTSIEHVITNTLRAWLGMPWPPCPRGAYQHTHKPIKRPPTNQKTSRQGETKTFDALACSSPGCPFNLPSPYTHHNHGDGAESLGPANKATHNSLPCGTTHGRSLHPAYFPSHSHSTIGTPSELPEGYGSNASNAKHACAGQIL